MEVKKVLWPTDFSSSAEKALPYVTDLTQKYGAEIHVLYVIEDIAHHDSWYGDFDKSHIDKLMAWADKSAKKRLDQICEKYLNSCPLYIKHIAVGDPAQEILQRREAPLKGLEIHHQVADGYGSVQGTKGDEAVGPENGERGGPLCGEIRGGTAAGHGNPLPPQTPADIAEKLAKVATCPE